VAGQADDADVEGEIFAAELRADADLAGDREQFLLSSTSRKAWPCSLPEVGQRVEYLVEASLTVLRQASAEVPPMTKAR
jgi:hypothetical protein